MKIKTILLQIGVFVPVLLLLAACSSNVPLSPFVDLSAPHIVSSSPTNYSSGVPSGVTVRINFSENINPDLFNSSSLVITPSFTHTLQWDGNALLIQPSGTLPAGQEFKVTVKAGVKDKNGNPMALDHMFKFRIAGTNLSQAIVTFKVDASAAVSSYPTLYLAGTWDGLGDYDSGWNKGVRYPLYDDGLHGDGNAGDGIWASSLAISVDLSKSYTWAIDDDNDPNNGYIRSSTFFATSSAPVTVLQTLHPPVPFTFVYHDLENKITGPVYLRGDVNGWSMNNPMSGPSGSDRAFSCTVILKEGTYNYKYFTDNSWDKVNAGANRQVSVVAGGSTIQNDYDAAGSSVTVNYYDIEGKVSTGVYLKGDFNGWSDANLMTGPVGPQRKFTTTVQMRAGNSYTYKFFCDGDWNKLNVDNRSLALAAGVSTVDDYYSGPRTITFNYYDLEGKVATSIYLRGDMNGWGLDYAWQMTQDPVTNYKYSLTVDLNAGTYNYKYFVDGDYGKVNVANRSLTVNAVNALYTHDIFAGY